MADPLDPAFWATNRTEFDNMELTTLYFILTEANRNRDFAPGLVYCPHLLSCIHVINNIRARRGDEPLPVPYVEFGQRLLRSEPD